MAYRPKYTSGQIQAWFIDKAFGSASPARARNILMRDEANRGRSNIIIGKMFLYRYDPKHKDKLPKYDRFPLVIPIEQYNDGWLGLNLHYLNLTERDALLSELIKISGSPRLNDRAKLQATYTTLKRTQLLDSLSRPCIKRYLFSHVRSRLIEIYPGEWDKVIELPVADWVFNR